MKVRKAFPLFQSAVSRFFFNTPQRHIATSPTDSFSGTGLLQRRHYVSRAVHQLHPLGVFDPAQHTQRLLVCGTRETKSCFARTGPRPVPCPHQNPRPEPSPRTLPSSTEGGWWDRGPAGLVDSTLLDQVVHLMERFNASVRPRGVGWVCTSGTETVTNRCGGGRV